MPNENLKCIDAGSEYCPCYLAETNDCIVCSQLSGKSFCDCNWNGVCIYQEYFWCGNKKKNHREISEAKIIQKKEMTEQVTILKLKTTQALARKLKHPGSYIFIRDVHKPVFFDVPMSIMKADENKGEIEIAVHVLGPKTKSLIACSNTVLIKGPYWNGILGFKDLKNMTEKKALLIARGISLAPSLLTVQYLLKNKNNVTFIMDSGKINHIFIDDYIKDLDIEKVVLNLRDQGERKIMTEILKNGNYDLVYSGGSDRLHGMIANEIKNLGMQTKHIITNNSEMCCGEGICGACSYQSRNGKVIKMCKTQLGAKDVLEGRKADG
ncbi:sulfide/dihydroorotate dehydrogenase-like FAD/NAD-binding protein [Clostridiaceae bacterium 35-E11]